MKVVCLGCLFAYALAERPFVEEVQIAFEHFDVDLNGRVTKEEVVDAVLKDAKDGSWTKEHIDEMMNTIDQMMKFDKNGDGFDFDELFKASGGRFEDL